MTACYVGRWCLDALTGRRIKFEVSTGFKDMLHNANTPIAGVADGMKLSIFDRIKVPHPGVGLKETLAAAE